VWWLVVAAAISCAHELPTDSQYGQPAIVVWRTPGSAAGRVSQDSALAFFPGDHNELIAVNKATGRIAWRSPTNEAYDGTLGFGTTVAGPLVIMVDVYLYAFDRANGNLRWVFEGEPGVNLANSNPTANDSVVFTGSGGGIVWALNALTGRVVWRRPAPVPYPVLAVHPVVSGDLLFVGYTEPGAGDRGAVGALNSNTGEVVWLHDFVQYVDKGQDAGAHGDVVVSPTTLYTWLGRGDILALDRFTGQLRWRVPENDGLAGTQRRPAALVRGVLVVGSTKGHMVGLDPSTGDTLWTRFLSYGSLNEPFAHDDVAVYVTIGGGHVAAVDPLTGAVLWSHGLTGYQTSLGLFGPGAVDGRNLYLGGTTGLYAFRK
jgi:outer membrane protein assembly factor BamB